MTVRDPESRRYIRPEILDDESNVLLCSAAAASPRFDVIEHRGSKREFLRAEEAWHVQGSMGVRVAPELVQVSKRLLANHAHEMHTMEMLH